MLLNVGSALSVTAKSTFTSRATCFPWSLTTCTYISKPLRDAPAGDSPGLHPASDLYSEWKIKKHLLRLATIKHARVDEVRTHNCGLDAIFSGRHQLQTNWLCKPHCSKLASTVVCKEAEESRLPLACEQLALLLYREIFALLRAANHD